jgi:hypothetical protein
VRTRFRFKSFDLNANPDPKHYSYRVLGLLAWIVLAFCFVCLVMAPRLLLEVARGLATYMILRLIILTILYLAGRAKFMAAERSAGANPDSELSGGQIGRHKSVHHLVVIPNLNEPQDILKRTLQSLCVQASAREQMTVVLGMEERDSGAKNHAEALLSLYGSKFFHLIATYHPADLPGEVRGKGTNEAWATRFARRELVHRLGISPDRIVVTVADADSIIHPHYFAELTRQFTANARRYSLIWQAPVLIDNEFWQTHALIRLVSFYSNVVSIGDYMNAWEPKFPYSTYSISLKLLEEVDYWDPTVITEDVNIFLRSFFRRGGQAFIQRIYLPFQSNPIFGANIWHALGIFYIQKMRQGLGGAEIGYLFQKWNYPPGSPFGYKIWLLLKLLHDHLIFSTGGIIIALGTMVSIVLDQTAVITLPPTGASLSLALLILNLLGSCSMLVIWLVERARLSRGRMDWSFRTLLGEVTSWIFFPALFLLLLNLPVLHAQTMMLLGRPPQFKRTPKRPRSTISDFQT